MSWLLTTTNNMIKNLKTFTTILITFGLFIFNTNQVTATIPNKINVVVAGARGVAAAIQAARLGSKVLLLEETDYIGG